MDIKLYFFPVMEWSTDTKTGYDDLEVYMEYGYVFFSSTGRNNVKMAAFSFQNSIISFQGNAFENVVFHIASFSPFY